MHDLIIMPLGPRALALKTKDFVSGEQPKLMTLCDHQQIVLMGVYGDANGRERLVGYCLLFSGAPTLHHYTRYSGLSYSEPQDIRTRQMLVIHDDDVVRLARFGVGVFDYLWVCKKFVEDQFTIDAADHAQHLLFRETWKDGI